jgi:endonuclease/exonuclease/phosphatase family metal-dependent hydrolase
MRIIGLFVVPLLVLGACSSSDPEAQDVTIDTFNLALAGAFIPYEAERRQPLADAIAEMDSDIVCLQEVWTQADKEMIRAAAATNFPNAVLFANDLDTPIDDPEDQNGDDPPAPTTVPCPPIEVLPGVTVEDQMSLAIECVSENCNTIAPGDQDGQTTSTECAQDFCLGEVAALILGDPQQLRCYSCLATQLPTSTFAEIGSSCPVIINQDLAFEGQNGVMILSRYPLKDPVNWVIPGTWNRRVIISATAELPNGSELDVYCNHLTPIFDSIAYPYTGQYGDGLTGAEGWEAEQQLQAKKLIDHVAATSGDTPAVILGDLNAGRAYPDESLVAEGAATLERLEAAFTPAYTESYEPQCTFCADNPLTDTTSSVWIDHILLNGLTSDAVQSTVRTFDEAVVPVGGDELVPLSDHYGLRSVIRIP